jgi:predicted dehydrogenase
MRPYNELRYRYNWNFFWDTGNGDIGNQGIHEMDAARWALAKEEMPQRVVSTGGKYVYDDDQETPNTQFATIDYGDSEIEFEVRGLSTGGEGSLQAGYNVIGNLFFGSAGWLALNGLGFQVYKGVGTASEKVLDVKAPRNDSFESMNTIPHMENFLAAVRSRNYKELNADVAVGVASANLVHMANASYRLKRELKCDERDAETTALLTRQYRAPYLVPDKV